MPYFSRVSPTANTSIFIVEETISADQSAIDSGDFGDPSTFVQTSYNTYGNVHYAPSPPNPPRTPDGGTPLRANFGEPGMIYDSSYVIDGVVGVFYTQQPYPSWVLNTSTFLWECPTPPGPHPDDGKAWYWNEATQSWDGPFGP